MANRLLHSHSGYFWCAFLVLALVPGLANAAPKYTRVTTSGVKTYENTQDYWVKQSIQHLFTGGVLETSSSLNVGSKALTIPTTVKGAATAGAHLARFAKAATPLMLGIELVSYLVDNIPDLNVTDDQWDKATPIDDGGFYNGSQPYRWRTSRTSWQNSAPEACQAHVASGQPNCPVAKCAVDGNCETIGSSTCGWMANGGTTFTSSGCGSYYSLSRSSNTCVAPTLWDATTSTCVDPPTQAIEPPTEQDWDDWVELVPLPPLSDTELGKMADNHPQGVPVETPVHPTLPQTQPLAEAYQDPATGNWYQPTARITPAPYPDVAVDTTITPVSGPEGIDEPVPYSGPEEPVSVDTGTTVTVENTIEVEICAEGDTRLMCTELGTPPEGEIPADTFDLTWDHAPVVFSEGACPVGPTAATPWGNVTIDMYWPCEFAKAIKSIILACAMFAAAYIFIGGLRTS